MENNSIIVEEHSTGNSEVKGGKEDLYHSNSDVSASTTVVGLVNGMISGAGICVVLPQLGLTAGWLTSLWVCLLTGLISYYTASLIVTHLGKGSSIKECILGHFGNDYKYMRIYGAFIWFNFIVQLVIYFKIICIQVQGLLGYNSPWVGPLVALVLFAAIILVRIFHIGEDVLAWGIISIITYVAFVAWSIATAPPGPNSVPTTGPWVVLTSSLMMGYSIHDFLVQNLIKNPRRHEYQGVVKSTFALGTLAYLYMTFGSFGIVNRIPVVKNPQAINNFFHPGMWQIIIIEVVLIVQMASVFPLFMIVSQIRFFQMFQIDVRKNINAKQVLYMATFTIICYLLYISNMNLQSLISFNGAMVGYSYVIVIPIGIHLKCLWKDRSSGFVDDDDEHNRGIMMNQCECNCTYRSKWTLYLETVFAVAILVGGFVLMVLTFAGVA